MRWPVIRMHVQGVNACLCANIPARIRAGGSSLLLLGAKQDVCGEGNVLA